MVFSGYSTDKTDRHDITEILLKVALNTINQPTWIYMNHILGLTKKKIGYMYSDYVWESGEPLLYTAW